jgi:hypothetical protein
MLSRAKAERKSASVIATGPDVGRDAILWRARRSVLAALRSAMN